MLEYKNGDILDIKEGMICHQVNCMGAYKSGLAGQIRAKYPWAYECYRRNFEAKADNRELLGTANSWLVSTSPMLYITDLHGQYNYGTEKRQTNYIYLTHALERAIQTAKELNLEMYVPYRLACGLAGGDWMVVEALLLDLSEIYEKKINIVIKN